MLINKKNFGLIVTLVASLYMLACSRQENIEEHQGEIKVESKLNVGTTITISLPHHIDSKVGIS